MSPAAQREATALAAVAAFLRQGETLHRFSCAVTWAALVAIAAMFWRAAEAAPALVFAAAALLGAAETYFAVRLSFDARLFSAAARSGNWDGVDDALGRLGFRTARQDGRTTESRIAGALRLFRRQAVAVGVQLLLVLVAPLA